MSVYGPIEFIHYWLGLSTDTKPTREMGAVPGDKFFETDTGIWYMLGGSGTWTETLSQVKITKLSITSNIAALTNFSVTANGTGYTHSGSAGYLLPSAALFNSTDKIAIYLNGTYQLKGVHAVWQSSASFQLSSIVDGGDEIVIIS